MGAILATIRAPVVRRLLVIFGVFRVAEFGVWIATTAVAFELGGVQEATVVVVAQLLPAAGVATMVGGWADRYGTRTVLTVGLFVQAIAMLGAGTVLAVGAPPVLVYIAGVVASCGISTSRPTIGAMVPEAVDGPRELAAANVAMGWLDGASVLIGPAVAALCISLVGTSAPFLVLGTATGVIAFVSFGLPASAGVGARRRRGAGEADIPSVRVALGEVTRAPGPRSVLLVLASRAYVEGGLDLLYVVIAVQVLDGNGADASWMNAASGAGALVGAGVATLLIGRRALWPAMLIGAGVAASALVGLGGARGTGAAAAMFLVVGAGSTLLLIASRTLLQRVTDLRLLCHAFSLAEAGDDTMVMVGSLTIPAVVAILAPQWAGAGIAVVLVVVVVSQIGAVAVADRRSQAPLATIELLRTVELFRVLSAPALETLAREAQRRPVTNGTVVIREGAEGSEFYVVRSGCFVIDHAGRRLQTCREGQGFGELALLFDAPRAATVTATEDGELLAIGREAFLVAVSGEQATVHGVAAYVQALDHPHGVWPAPES